MLEKIFIPQVYLPIIYICVAIIINGIFKRLISHIISSKQEKLNKNSYNYKKAETFRTFLINISKYFIIKTLEKTVPTEEEVKEKAETGYKDKIQTEYAEARIDEMVKAQKVEKVKSVWDTLEKFH